MDESEPIDRGDPESFEQRLHQLGDALRPEVERWEQRAADGGLPGEQFTNLIEGEAVTLEQEQSWSVEQVLRQRAPVESNTGLRATTPDQALASLRGYITSLPGNETIRSQELFPPKFAPYQITASRATSYWYEQLKVPLSEIRIVPLEPLAYFVGLEKEAIRTNWARHVEELEQTEHAVLWRITNWFSPKSAVAPIARDAATLGRQSVRSTVLELTLPIAEEVQSSIRLRRDRRFQIGLADYAAVLDELISRPKLKANVQDYPPRSRISDPGIALRLHELLQSLRTASSERLAYQVLRSHGRAIARVQEQGFLGQDPLQVLGMTYTALQERGVEVIYG